MTLTFATASDLACFQAGYQIRDTPVQDGRADADADEQQRLKDADRGHDAEQQIGGSKFA